MIKKAIVCGALWLLSSTQSTLAAYSSIVEATGDSCEADGGDAQRLQLALTDARRNAAEAVQTSVEILNVLSRQRRD